MKTMKLVSYHINRKGTGKNISGSKSIAIRKRHISESEIRESIALKETPYNMYYKDFLFQHDIVISDIKEVPYLEE